jgi:hypothetical protein
MNDFLRFRHMKKENRWRVEKGDLMRFLDYLLVYFEQTPLFDKELLARMEHGELEDGEFRLISFLFNLDHSDERGLFLTEALPDRLPVSLRECSFTLYLYPSAGSPYDDFSVLPARMKLR